MKKKLFIAMILAVAAMGIELNVLAYEDEIYEVKLAVQSYDGNYDVSGNCGENVSWDWNSTDKVLTISGTGKMKDYYQSPLANSDPNSYDDSRVPEWYSFRSKIKTIIINDGITAIGNAAFVESGVTDISLPSSLSSIGEKSFQFCNKLEYIDLPNSLTSIGYRAFLGSGLKEVFVPGSVSYWGEQVFDSCEQLESVEIGAGVTMIGNSAFVFCSALKTVTIPDSVTYIGEMAFHSCSSLETIFIPKSISGMGFGVFYYCENLKNIDVDEHNAQYSSVNGVLFNKSQDIIMAYPAGKDDNYYEIPYGVSIIGQGTFWECGHLETLIIPETVTTIDNLAFEGCSFNNIYCIGNKIETKWDSYGYNYNIHFNSHFVNILIDKDEFIYPVGGGEVLDVSDIEITGYELSLYTDRELTNKFDIAKPISENVILYAKYDTARYTYRFIDYDGTVLKEDVAAYGTELIPPELSQRPSTKKYRYVFTGWKDYSVGMLLTSDVEFTAEYTESLNKYTYVFTDYNDNELKSVTADYGTKIIPPQAPSREADEQYSYTFNKWSGFIEGIELTDDMTFKAEYSTTVNTYTYEFIDSDGSILKKETVEYGTPIIPPSKPSKLTDGKYSYNFSLWDGYTEGMTVTNDIRFTANYSQTEVVYEHGIYVFNTTYASNCSDKNATVIAAVYDENGKLLGIGTANAMRSIITVNCKQGS